MHSPGATSPNSDVHHWLPQSLASCSTIVAECFCWRCQKILFKWNALHLAIATHYEMLPSHPTKGLMRVLLISALTFYQYFTQ